MSSFTISSVSNTIGGAITGQLVGGEYLGWTGFPGFQAQSDAMSIGHLRWPGGINAEDRIENGVHAYDLATSNLVDNWPTWNGSDRPGFAEMAAHALANNLSLSIVVPTARYVELATTDSAAAFAWLRSDIETFTSNLASGAIGPMPNLTLEIGAEYYSTNVWENASGATEIRDLFAEVFSELVGELAKAEDLHGELYDVTVQMGRFQSQDDPVGGVRNGEANDSVVFLNRYAADGTLDNVDGVIWHRYTERFDQIDDAIRNPIHPDNAMSSQLADHLAVWEEQAQRDLDLVLSWSAPDIDSSGATDNPNFDHGPRSAHNILQMFSEISATSADIATVYGIDSQWPGALSYGSPEDPDIYYAGSVYGMIAESVIGLSVTDTYQQNALPVTELNDVVETDYVSIFEFSGEDRFVFFAVAGDLVDDQLSVDVDIPNAERFDYVKLTRLTPEGDDAFATGAMTFEAPETLTSETLNFEFKSDFEVVRIEFSDAPPPPTGTQNVETYFNREGGITQVIGTTSEEDGLRHQEYSHEMQYTDPANQVTELEIYCDHFTFEF